MNNNSFLDSNVSAGTLVGDGYRAGKLFNDMGLDDNKKLKILRNSAAWGEGVLQSNINTYNIVPRNSATGETNVALGVSVADGVAFDVSLSPDNYITTFTNNSNNDLQLDWPRALAVKITAGVNAVAINTPVIVKGVDFHGSLLTENIVVSATVNANTTTTFFGKKAFYMVKSVTYTGVSGATIEVLTTNTLGLPYKLDNKADLLELSIDGISQFQPNGDANIALENILYDGVAPFGSADLGAGTVTIPYTKTVDASSFIFCRTNETANAVGGNAGTLRISATVANTSFTITSSNGADTGTVSWIDVNYLKNNPFTKNYVIASGTVTLNDAAKPTVTNAAINATSGVMFSRNTSAGTAGMIYTTRVGNTITFASTNALDTSTVNYCIVKPFSLTNTEIGSSTVISGALAAGDINIVTANTSSATQSAWLGFSFPISAPGNANTVNLISLQPAQFGGAPQQGHLNALLANGNINNDAGEVMQVNTVFFPLQKRAQQETVNLNGTLTLADDTAPSALTGDVRGTYTPNVNFNGTEVFKMVQVVKGADVFVEQQAKSELSGGGEYNTQTLRAPLDVTDLLGLVQYSGN